MCSQSINEKPKFLRYLMFAAGSALAAVTRGAGVGGKGAGADTLPAMPLLPSTSQRTVELGGALKTNKNDIFVSSYPKSGTTWTQYIV